MSEHKPTTAKEHEEWKRLDEAATPTPWDGIVSSYAVRHDYPAETGMTSEVVCTVYKDVDRELIAVMRNNFRRLIEKVEEARKDIDGLNVMLRDHTYGQSQGRIDVYVAQCEEIKRLKKQAKTTRDLERQECCDAIRTACLTCKGTGIDHSLEPTGPCMWCGIPIGRIKEMEDE